MYEANGSKILDAFRALLLGDQNRISYVDKVDVLASEAMEGIDSHCDITLDYAPAQFEEGR